MYFLFLDFGTRKTDLIHNLVCGLKVLINSSLVKKSLYGLICHPKNLQQGMNLVNHCGLCLRSLYTFRREQGSLASGPEICRKYEASSIVQVDGLIAY